VEEDGGEFGIGYGCYAEMSFGAGDCEQSYYSRGLMESIGEEALRSIPPFLPPHSLNGQPMTGPWICPIPCPEKAEGGIESTTLVSSNKLRSP